MAKNSMLAKAINVIVWLTGVLVSLAVGFGMIDGVLTVRWIPAVVAIWAGWIVVVLTIVGLVLAIVNNS